MEKKNIVLYVILSIVTCGIFGLIWTYWVAKTYEDAQLTERLPTTAPITILLCIITCNIYGIYCFYKWGLATPELFSRYGKNTDDKSVLYLVLSLFSFNIINLCLIQNDFNNLADSVYPPTYPPQNAPYPPQGGPYSPSTTNTAYPTQNEQNPTQESPPAPPAYR